MRVPRGVLLVFAATPVAAGVALIGARTAPAAGVLLLAAFAASVWYLVTASRRHDFLGGEAAEIRDEAEEHAADKRRWWRPVGLTLFGLAVITIGAELVNYGADGIVHRFAFPAAIMGMIVWVPESRTLVLSWEFVGDQVAWMMSGWPCGWSTWRSRS